MTCAVPCIDILYTRHVHLCNPLPHVNQALLDERPVHSRPHIPSPSVAPPPSPSRPICSILNHVVQRAARPRRPASLRCSEANSPTPRSSGWERGVGLMAPSATRRTPRQRGGAGLQGSRAVTSASPASNPVPIPMPNPDDSGAQPQGTALPSILDHVVQRGPGHRRRVAIRGAEERRAKDVVDSSSAATAAHR